MFHLSKKKKELPTLCAVLSLQRKCSFILTFEKIIRCEMKSTQTVPGYSEAVITFFFFCCCCCFYFSNHPSRIVSDAHLLCVTVLAFVGFKVCDLIKAPLSDRAVSLRKQPSEVRGDIFLLSPPSAATAAKSMKNARALRAKRDGKQCWKY